MYKKEPWTINEKQIKKPKLKKRGPEAEDLTGKTFGKLRVLKRVENEVSTITGRSKVRFLCQCECGNQKIVSADNLRSGQVSSCGCLRGKHSKTKNNKKQKGKTLKRKVQSENKMDFQEIIKKEVKRRLNQEKLKKTSFKLNLFGWKIILRRNK